MTFIEFKRRDGTRFLIDFASHWEIDDKGDKPAMWSNHQQGRNMDCADTYEQVRANLLKKDTPMTNTTNTAAASGAADNCTILPDGSAFAVGSFPLPQDHWLYAPHEYEPGADEPKELLAPILTHAQRNEVVAAVRYAVRGATMCGKEPDFDPDALVQNAVYALCGPFGRTALATTALELLAAAPTTQQAPQPSPTAQAAESVLEDAAQESEYRRGYRHGYEQRDAEVRGALA